MITLFPLYSAPVLLRFTGTHLAAVCGFITGLVILPNSIRLKFNESSPESERLHGHTSYLKKITLFVSLCLNAVTLLVTIVVFIIIRRKDHAHNFLRLMKAYHSSVPC
ncbi:hypothetical protein WA026_008999 [Henosepilachna vigintioctopunctata]|uniref:Uncharacterized protein n=1 Tax=Henosepilachna vigintioctopunctata TaxID=420089 RepID=A0AAW1UQE3_9CUCU